MSGQNPIPREQAYEGVRAVNPPDTIKAKRAPTTNDKKYAIGTLWINVLTNTAYMLTSAPGIWSTLGTGTTGSINSITGDSGGAEVPLAGNFNIKGTANQVTVAGSANTETLSIPNTFIAPGSIASTTSTTVGNALTVTTGGILVSGGDIINSHSSAAADVTMEVTNSDNTSGSSRAGVEIATGGASSGDPYLSFQISGVGASTMTMGLDNSASDIFAISNSTAVGTSNALTLSQAGALTATTSLTAANGNLTLGTAGNKIVIATGANASVGTSAAMSGTPGAVTVATTASSATAKIFYSRATTGGTPGHVSITAQDGTGFTLTSTGNETSTFNWWIINA